MNEFMDAKLSRDRLVPKSNNLSDFLFKEVQSARGGGSRPVLPSVKASLDGQVGIGKPIDFVLTAVAHKSPSEVANAGRTSPDLAELGFLLHLNDIIYGVQSFYPPGARFTFLTEGQFFKSFDLFDVSDEEIQEYEDGVASLANAVNPDGFRFVPLKSIIDRDEDFGRNVVYEKAKIEAQDYEPFIGVMQRAMSKRQIDEGVAPEDMAKSYVAIRNAKHQKLDGSGRSSVQAFLDEEYGANGYIYCSLNASGKMDTLSIDPYRTPATNPPPQHGRGVLLGGTSRIDVVPYEAVEDQARSTHVHQIIINELGQEPFGYINQGKRRV